MDTLVVDAIHRTCENFASEDMRRVPAEVILSTAIEAGVRLALANPVLAKRMLSHFDERWNDSFGMATSEQNAAVAIYQMIENIMEDG